MTARRWPTGDALVVGAIVIAGGLWFVYGLFGPAAYASEGSRPPVWFRWEALAYLTVALAVIIGVFLPFARGFVSDAALVATVIGSLGLGVALGGGHTGGLTEEVLGEFFVVVLLLGATAWLGGVLVGALWGWAGRRWPRGARVPAHTLGHARPYEDWRLPAGNDTDVVSGAASIALGAFIAFGLVAFILLRMNSSGGVTSFPPMTQSTSKASITIRSTLWGAANHSFLPMLGERTVALRVRYLATNGELAYSPSDWVGRDSDGLVYRPVAWPIRVPLGSGVLQRREGVRETRGWIAFVIPEDTKRLTLTFRQDDTGPLHWTAGSDGSRRAVPVE